MTMWRKSSYSQPDNPSCVELASLGGMVGVRDSKNPGGGNLSLYPARFAGLLGRIKAGRYDR